MLQTPERIVHSAAHLVLSITTTVRPQFQLQMSSVQSLFNMASQGAIGQLTNEVNNIRDYIDVPNVTELILNNLKI